MNAKSQKHERSPVARAIGAQLKIPAFRKAAVQTLSEAFRATGGNATQAAARLGVSWRALMGWCAEHPDVRSELEKARAKAKKAKKAQQRSPSRRIATLAPTRDHSTGGSG